jgi:protein-tyrosine-phosphatase
MSVQGLCVLVVLATVQKVSPQNVQATKENRPARVVFVCEHGAALSVISAAYFNKLAEEQHLNYHAVARGVTPQDKVSAQATTGLKQDRLASEIERPLPLSQEDLNEAARIVTFFPIPDTYSTKSLVEEWGDVTWKAGSYKKSRDAILEHMQDFLRKLRAATK